MTAASLGGAADRRRDHLVRGSLIAPHSPGSNLVRQHVGNHAVRRLGTRRPRGHTSTVERIHNLRHGDWTSGVQQDSEYCTPQRESRDCAQRHHQYWARRCARIGKIGQLCTKARVGRRPGSRAPFREFTSFRFRQRPSRPPTTLASWQAGAPLTSKTARARAGNGTRTPATGPSRSMWWPSVIERSSAGPRQLMRSDCDAYGDSLARPTSWATSNSRAALCSPNGIEPIIHWIDLGVLSDNPGAQRSISVTDFIVLGERETAFGWTASGMTRSK